MRSNMPVQNEMLAHVRAHCSCGLLGVTHWPLSQVKVPLDWAALIGAYEASEHWMLHVLPWTLGAAHAASTVLSLASSAGGVLQMKTPFPVSKRSDGQGQAWGNITYRHGLGTQQPAASVQLKPAKHVIVGLGWNPVEHCRLAAANCASQLPLGLS
jgi:hypothetical protein